MTVSWLLEHARAAEALRALASAPFITFRPRIHRSPEGAVMLYPGDAGYEANDPAREGARHRILALPGGWRYERSEQPRQPLNTEISTASGSASRYSTVEATFRES